MPVRHNKPSVVLSLALVIPAVACGSDDNKKKTDGGIVVHDTGPGIDAPAACAVPSTESPTFGSNNSQAINLGTQLGGAGTQADRWVGVLGTAQTDPELNVIIFSGGNGSASPDWPTLAMGPASNLSLDFAAQTDYFSEIAANFDGSGQPQDTYAATAGTLNITASGSANGSTFSGNISNATFTHGSIGSDGSFTPDADGCTTTIANATFSSTLGSGFAPTIPFVGGYAEGTLRHRFK